MGVMRFISSFKDRYRDYKLRKAGLVIGKGTVLRNGFWDYGSEPYLIHIGENCRIAAGAKFVTHDGGMAVFRHNPENAHINKFGRIELKDNVHIGINSIIMPNVTIGPNSVVGAGSVVRRNVPPNAVVAGNPARVVSTLEEYYKICAEDTIAFPDNSSKREVLVEHFWRQ